MLSRLLLAMALLIGLAAAANAQCANGVCAMPQTTVTHSTSHTVTTRVIARGPVRRVVAVRPVRRIFAARPLRRLFCR